MLLTILLLTPSKLNSWPLAASNLGHQFLFYLLNIKTILHPLSAGFKLNGCRPSPSLIYTFIQLHLGMLLISIHFKFVHFNSIMDLFRTGRKIKTASKKLSKVRKKLDRIFYFKDTATAKICVESSLTKKTQPKVFLLFYPPQAQAFQDPAKRVVHNESNDLCRRFPDGSGRQ